MPAVPQTRVVVRRDLAPRADGEYVLYWMIASRRTRWNFALERALGLSVKLGRPLLVLEPLRCGHRWASERFHAFVIQGMRDNAERLGQAGIGYYPYLEPEIGAGRGLLEALAERAAVVVTDRFPCFFLPRMVTAATERLSVRLEEVDSNGLLPLAAAPKVFGSAHEFRRFLQRHLPEQLSGAPAADPLEGLPRRGLAQPPEEIRRRWPADLELDLARLPIDHRVGPVALHRGPRAAAAALERFLDQRLPRYATSRSHPDEQAASGLSPYLHFGHLAVHQVLSELIRREVWDPSRLGPKPTGHKAGWWGMSANAEAFLDEIVTWRELGYNMSSLRDDFECYESLPWWCRATLEKHEADRRDPLVSPQALESAETHDVLWNAAQRQLLRDGQIHNYLRMLWGKKIVEWMPTPRAALQWMIELNNKYALDGRDPNSYSGIFWVLGRYDRPWGPERPIFGTIRYMSSANTLRKLRVTRYLERYA